VPDVLDERFFRNVAHELGSVIDYRLRDATNHVSLREIHEFADLHNIRNDPRIGNRHFVRQPGDTGTVRSGRRDEDLEVEILFKTVQDLDGVLRETGLRFRNIDQAAEED